MSAMGDQALSERQARLWLLAILILAVGLRVWTFRPYALHHPDELYQYLEQAHRLISRQGIIPWEYRVEMRSWLPPLLLSLPMRLGEAISPGSQLPVVLTRACIAAISLAPVIAAYFLGGRLSRLHGLVAAAVLAVWFENLYFADNVLTEVLAVACLLPAAALIRPDASPRAMMTAGGLLALAVLLRFHYAPALAVFVLVTLGTNWPGWRQLVVGGLIVLAASATVDVAMGQVPFGWIVANIDHNIIKGASERFGVSGPFYYFEFIIVRWGLAAVILVLLPLFVARRFPGLFLAALVNLAVHMAIGHKESRFIWLTVEIFVLLSAIASVELARRLLDRRRAGSRAYVIAAILLAVGWAGASAALASTDRTWPNWNRFGARMQATADVGRVPELCGLAVHGIDYWSASHLYLRRDVPIYLPYRRNRAEAVQALARSAPAYNLVMAPAKSAGEIPGDYQQLSCRFDGEEKICLYRRPGGCNSAGAEQELLQRVIADYGY
jgi:hypothetical protein